LTGIPVDPLYTSFHTDEDK